MTATLVRGGGTVYYVARDKEEAGKLSNTVMNRFNERDEIKAVDFVLAVVMENGKTGQRSGVTYCIDSGVSGAKTNKIGTGIYLQGNTVIFLRTQAAAEDEYKFVEQICGKLGLISPSKAE